MSICLINPERGLDQILELFNDSVVRRCLKTGSSVPPDVVTFLDTQELTTIEEEGLVGGRRVGMCTWWIRTTALQESDVSIINITAPLHENPPEEEHLAFRRYGNRQSGLRQRLSPASTTTLVVSRRANRHEAKAFGLAVRAPLLEVHDQLENADSIPIAYGITTCSSASGMLSTSCAPSSDPGGSACNGANSASKSSGAGPRSATSSNVLRTAASEPRLRTKT